MPRCADLVARHSEATIRGGESAGRSAALRHQVHEERASRSSSGHLRPEQHHDALVRGSISAREAPLVGKWRLQRLEVAPNRHVPHTRAKGIKQTSLSSSAVSVAGVAVAADAVHAEELARHVETAVTCSRPSPAGERALEKNP